METDLLIYMEHWWNNTDRDQNQARGERRGPEAFCTPQTHTE
jgi:hypothetical protein